MLPECDRDKHVRELAALYTRWRKRPFNAAIRAEVRSMAAHRYTPTNHRVYQLLGTLNRVSTTAAQDLSRVVPCAADAFLVSILMPCVQSYLIGSHAKGCLCMISGGRRRDLCPGIDSHASCQSEVCRRPSGVQAEGHPETEKG